jgi:hypothetical protein
MEMYLEYTEYRNDEYTEYRNEVLVGTFGEKRRGITARCTILRNDQLRNLYPLINMRWF